MPDPSSPLRSLNFYLGSFLKMFRDVAVSVQALKRTCAEKINGFEEAYARHYEDASKGSQNVPNVAAPEQIVKDFYQLTQAIQELYAVTK